MDATKADSAVRDDRFVMLTRERIEAATAAGHWPNRTACDYLDEALRDYPDKVFVTDYKTETGVRTTLSYRDIDRISRRIGAGLAAHGIEKGDVVAFQLPNWWEFAALHLACVRIGAISNPLMPIFRARELEFMLSFAETRALFIPRIFRGFEYEPMIESLRGKLPRLDHVFVLGSEGENGFGPTFVEERWEDEIDTRALFDERRVDPNEVIEICYTSGTTGQPKGVMHTSNTLAACAGLGPDRLALPADTVVLMASPLAHQTGYLYGFLLPLRLGARTVLQDLWNAETAARIIHDERVTFTMGATPFLADLAHTDALERYPTTSLRTFVTAGAPGSPGAGCRRRPQRLGTNVAAGWGMTENGLVDLHPSERPAGEGLRFRRGAVGRDGGAGGGRGGQVGPARRIRRFAGAGGRELRRLSQAAGSLRHGRGRVVRHRRHRVDGRERLHPHHQPRQGHHHPRRRERAGRRGGGAALPARRGARCGDRRDARPADGRARLPLHHPASRRVARLRVDAALSRRGSSSPSSTGRSGSRSSTRCRAPRVARSRSSSCARSPPPSGRNRRGRRKEAGARLARGPRPGRSPRAGRRAPWPPAGRSNRTRTAAPRLRGPGRWLAGAGARSGPPPPSARRKSD